MQRVCTPGNYRNKFLMVNIIIIKNNIYYNYNYNTVMRKNNKNITKRPRYKNRRRILRGGNIDNDADQLLANLNGLDHRSIVDFLEKLKTDPEFRNGVKEIEFKERSSQFDTTLKSTCNYTKSLDTFVYEMITTVVNRLRNEPAPPSTTETSEEPKQKLTPDTISGLLPENVELDALLNNLMERYAKAKVGPCLSVEGQKAIISQRAPVDPNIRRQPFPLRKGGSRRKNKKSKRMRRKQRGGLLFLLGLLGVGIVMLVYVKYKEWRREKNDVVIFIKKGDSDFK